MARRGHKVFISEYQMPQEFRCVWEKEVTNSLNPNITKRPVERLFTIDQKEEMKETYCLEDTLYNTKRYFTFENGVVSGTEVAQEYFNIFLDLASRLGYKVVKL